MEVDKGINLDDSEWIKCVNSDVKLEKEYEGCSRCFVLQNRISNAEDKCARLELDIGSKNSLIKRLEDKMGIIKSLEEEIRTLKQRNCELENSFQNSFKEEDKVTQLMIENKVLECEKIRAETELEAWKTKFKELEMRVKQLEKSVPGDHKKMVGSATPPINTPLNHGLKKGKSNEFKSGVKKGLDFTVEGSPHQHISPSTPGGRSCFVPIDISDSEDDINTAQGVRNVQCSADIGLGVAPGKKELTSEDRCKPVENHIDEKEINCCTEGSVYLPKHKRKRVRRGIAYIVNSESESDYDDNIPISQLLSKPLLERTTDNLSNTRSTNNTYSGGKPQGLPPRRRLMRVGDCESTKSQNRTENVTLDDCEIEEDGSSSEGESLGGFIVDDSYVSEGEPSSNCNNPSENHVSENDKTLSSDGSSASESSVAYDEIISSLRRERRDKMKWTSEGEMLSDFGKYPELCMKAICALYRQQTSEEKSFKATLHNNGRGFSQIHAFTGSELAEFLTDGDSQSDMKKSVEELQEFDAKGVEKCWKLATHYSKQLFEIYKNGEDPFFRP